MQILVVTFQLAGLDDQTYRQHAAAIAPRFLAVPGLVGKVWLADAETGTYGGVYAFEDARAVDRYLDSEIVRAMQADPHLVDLRIRRFGTIEAATRITQGWLGLYLDKQVALSGRGH